MVFQVLKAPVGYHISFALEYVCRYCRLQSSNRTQGYRLILSSSSCHRNSRWPWGALAVWLLAAFGLMPILQSKVNRPYTGTVNDSSLPGVGCILLSLPYLSTPWEEENQEVTDHTEQKEKDMIKWNILKH
jgi:hypothetical protein